MDGKGLTEKQKMFCREYIIDLNATQAAIRAGYSAKTASASASRLLNNVNISLYIKELKDKRAEELELDAYWVLKRLKDISDRAMQAEPVYIFDPVERCMVESGEYQFDSTGANKATELIGRHIGMFDLKLSASIDKTKAETELIKERTKLIKGASKDTGLLEHLIDVVKDGGKL